MGDHRRTRTRRLGYRRAHGLASRLRERSEYARDRFEAQAVSRTSVRFHRDRAHQEAVNARFENQTTRDKEPRHSISPRSTPRILAHPKILSLQFLFRATRSAGFELSNCCWGSRP